MAGIWDFCAKQVECKNDETKKTYLFFAANILIHRGRLSFSGFITPSRSFATERFLILGALKPMVKTSGESGVASAI